MGTFTCLTSREQKCGKTKFKAIDYCHNRVYSTNLKIFTRCQLCDIFLYFCSTLYERALPCELFSSTFPIMPYLPSTPSCNRRKRPVSSAVPKPCATLSQGSASKRSLTRCIVRIPLSASGSIVLPTKAPKVCSTVPAPVDRLK